MPRAASSVEPLESRRHLATDLVAESYPSFDFLLGPSRPLAGGFGLSNRGTTGTARRVPYRIVLRTGYDDTGRTDITIGEGSTEAPLAGKSGVYVEYSFALPAAAYGQDGELLVIVDPANRIDESNETNNEQVGLNSRRLVATPLVGTRVDGTEGNDRFRVEEHGDDLVVYAYDEATNRETLRMADVAAAPKLTFDLRGGLDNLDAARTSVPIEALAGAGVDFITGGGGDDTIVGGDGDDRIDGQGGNDSLLGDAGEDFINGNGGNDFVGGGSGNDNLAGGEGDDRLAGDTGDDAVRGDAGNDRVAGNAGRDSLKGGDGDDTLLGQDGRDRLHGNAGVGLLLGGAGNDILAVDPNGIDTLNGGTGDDTAYATASAILASIERRVGA